MLDKKFATILEKFLLTSDLNCHIESYYHNGYKIYNLVDKNGNIWFDLYSQDMNWKVFSKELNCFGTMGQAERKEYSIIVDALNNRFRRKERIKRLLKEI